MKVAIVGLDSAYWPHAFARQLRAAGAVIVGFTDLGVDGARLRANLGMTAAEYGVRYDLRPLPDLDAALAEAEGIAVCTRNTIMPELAVNALCAGRHVFAAKPVAVRIEHLQAIRPHLLGAACFTAGQTARSHHVLRSILQLVRQGAVGEVHTVRVMHQHGRYRDWAAGTWYADPGEGNACHWLGWYALDAAVALLGPVEELWGFAQQRANPFPGQPDHLKAVAHHRNGKLSTLEIYCDIGSDWGLAFIECEVVGTEGVVRYVGPEDFMYVHDARGVRRLPLEPQGDPLAQELSAWIQACQSGGEPVLPGSMALHVAAGGCAWAEASRTETRRARVSVE